MEMVNQSLLLVPEKGFFMPIAGHSYCENDSNDWFILRLLKCQLDSPKITLSAGILARGSNQSGGNVTAVCQLDTIGNVWGHDEIGIPVAQLGL